ncbi:hypothetical protein FOL47_007879 [Perkinsus chesapeaki]|uniref:Amino acid transporter transmembrane domain-containing protein n=1 Tax=Perkinsus chesapeaki TaxID=330153 RepID=A0A7J6LHT1_PERCH|nr:hypothetical protein FOL47_007879 [Perkinsus chesapeaki]
MSSNLSETNKGILTVEEAKRGMSVLRAANSVTMSVVGIGMLVLPLTTKECGIIAGSCLLFIAVVITYIGGYLTWKSLLMKPNAPPGTIMPTFESIGLAAFGHLPAAYFSALLHANLSGICACLLVLQASISLSLTKVLNLRAWIVIWIAVGIPLSWVKQMKNVGLLAIAGVTSSVSLLAVIVVACIQRIISEEPAGPYNLATSDPLTLMGCLATYIFALSHPVLAPTVANAMEKPMKYPLASAISSLLLIVLYGTVMILGYFAFGNSLLTYDTIADAIAPTTGTLSVIGWILNIVIIIVVATHYVVLLSPTALALDGLVSAVSRRWGLSARVSLFLVLASRSGLVILQGVVGIAFLSVNKLVTFLGAFGTIQLSFTIPLISYMRLMRLRGSPFTGVKLAMCYLLIILSLFITGVAMYKAVRLF